jgi:hypothetical protein
MTAKNVPLKILYAVRDAVGDDPASYWAMTVVIGRCTGGCTDQSAANMMGALSAPETAAERDRLRAVNAELLEALGDAIAMLEHYQSGRADNWTRGRALSTIKDARTAIAKARGE